MGIDHGLGGKDNAKSQQKRAKKAARIKTLAKKALTGGKKKEVKFDENSRVEWLTGFRKRKQERRKFGLAMQILKDKKTHKEIVKEQRSHLRSLRNDLSGREKRQDMEDSENEDDINQSGKVTSGVERVYEDDDTTAMFGGSVSVQIDTGVGDLLEELANPDKNIDSCMRFKKGRTRELTALEKALKEAGGKLNQRKPKGKSAGKLVPGNNKLKVAKGKGGAAAKQLLHKAMGSGALGNNPYKKNGKGRKGR